MTKSKYVHIANKFPYRGVDYSSKNKYYVVHLPYRNVI